MDWELAPKLDVIVRHPDKGSSLFSGTLEISRCCPCAKGVFFLGVWSLYTYLDYSSPIKVLEKIVAGKLSHFLESNSLLPLSQFSYRRGLGALDALLTMLHHLQVALNRDMEGRLIQLDVSSALNRVKHCGLLHKMRSIDVGRQFESIVSQKSGRSFGR